LRFTGCLAIVCLSACVDSGPGVEMENPRAYIGCYELPRGEVIELSSGKLLMKDRDANFQVEFRKDKFGDLAVATPGLWFEGRGSQELVERGQNGSILRFNGGDLSLPALDGSPIRARRISCGTDV